jgi:transposase
MRNSKDKKVLRYRIVVLAQEKGIPSAAAECACSVNTVRKWLRRYNDKGYDGLEELSRAPHHSKRISEADKKVIIKNRNKYRGLGLRRLKEAAGLTYSIRTMNKVLREVGLIKKRRTKAKKKNNLRAIKSAYKLFSQIEVDTKHLYDIPEYYSQMRLLNLPKYQYTARDVTSGFLFIYFAYESSLCNSFSFLEQLVQHLTANGADLSNTVIQTDNGSEFIGSWNAKKNSAFTEKVESYSMIHKTIPPKAHTWQADVETSHNLIENEFYTIEAFNSTSHLQQKMAVYLLWFNFLRKNSYKENQTPLQIGIAKVPELNNKIANFKPVILDYWNYDELDIKDHDVGVRPCGFIPENPVWIRVYPLLNPLNVCHWRF